MKFHHSLAFCALLAAGTAFAGTHTVSISAPGGHSYGSYGNTNAVHAAANAIREIEKALPEAVVSDFNGGSTVNAIATDAAFKVTIKNEDAAALEKLKKAIDAGVARENAFRGVKAGDLTASGAPAHVRWKME
ncbi:peptidase dimerization domain-containing protein [Sutterella massiliensis]|uniref:Peptidase dimerization domain-containing protein n=1 Tax=Sutterella massiliensis TaxID=1816689 RepID=A0ABS2DSE4_9BURK|nr:peptidase dimerization domain-containing protein [Sutterella massiliensis]MBM6704253.1 peptidase dimerization domain-containing protein [Sutterella massiliensis]